MSALAVIVGIDNYEFAPLTSAVHDALAVRDTLVALNLVKTHEVVLLTDPPQPGGGSTTRESINDVLREVYDDGSRIDRLYLFFAGHGVSGYVDAAHSVTETLFVPSDVADPFSDPGLLINFDDLRRRFERAGPREQFLYFDACRDLVYAERPVNLPRINWPASKSATTGVAQSTLYAVSLGEKALGLVDGLGVMTQHLIDALHGQGRALDWSDADGAHVVTAQSVASHVRTCVEDAAKGRLQWSRQIMLPELRDVGAPLAPIRLVPHPPKASLTLTYEPPHAHAATEVTLQLRGQPVSSPAWPPTLPLMAAPAGPYSYRVCPTNPAVSVHAVPERVDLRVEGSAVIRLGPPGGPTPPAPEPEPGVADVTSAPPATTRGLAGDLARVRADADEPGTMIELIGTDPPYDRQKQASPMDEVVAPGSYLLRFRQGEEVYSEVVLDLVAGESAHVRPGAARSPLLSEARIPDHDGSVYVSSTSGYVRSGTLSTVLTLLGLVPFDPAGTLQTPFHRLVAGDDPERYAKCPVRVVIAVEGSGWTAPAHEVARQLSCELIDAEGDRARMPLTPVEEGEIGWARVVHGTAQAPGRSFTVRVTSSWAGAVEIASTALTGRVTVLALTLTADGRTDLVQHVLRVPGRAYDEMIPDIGYDRFLRELVLGQRLYASGELLEQRDHDDGVLARLEDLLFAKWTDPILGCMAYLALAERTARGLPDILGDLADVAANNLYHYFDELPDARVIAAHAGVRGAPALAEALDPGETPVLAQSLRLAASAPGTRQDNYRRWLRFVAPTSSWTLAWRPEIDAAPVNPRGRAYA